MVKTRWACIFLPADHVKSLMSFLPDFVIQLNSGANVALASVISDVAAAEPPITNNNFFF